MAAERFGGLILTTTGGNSLRQPQHPPLGEVPVGFAKVRVFVHVKWSVRFRAPSPLLLLLADVLAPLLMDGVSSMPLRFGWVKHRGVGRRMVFFSFLFSGDEQRQRLFPFAPEPPLSCSNQKGGDGCCLETAGDDGANRPWFDKVRFRGWQRFWRGYIPWLLTEGRLRRRKCLFPWVGWNAAAVCFFSGQHSALSISWRLARPARSPKILAFPHFRRRPRRR